MVYRITKAIVEGGEEFARVTAAMKGVTAKDMAQNHGLPIHPGAGKYSDPGLATDLAGLGLLACPMLPQKRRPAIEFLTPAISPW